MSVSDHSEISWPSAGAVAGMWDFLRVLFETAPHGIVIHDAGGAILNANVAAERLMGLSVAQMQGRESMDPRWKAIREDASPFPPEFHPAMRALRSGKPSGSAVMGVVDPRLGRTTWLEMSAVPVFRPGEPTPFQAFAMLTDITGLKLAGQAARESEQRFRSIFESSPEALLIRPVDGPYLEVNQCALDRYGYTREEIIGMQPEDLVPARLRGQVRARIREALETGVPAQWAHRHKDGTEIPVILHVRPLLLLGKPCIYEVAQSAAGAIQGPGPQNPQSQMALD